jgi:hypothetical protein
VTDRSFLSSCSSSLSSIQVKSSTTGDAEEEDGAITGTEDGQSN